MTQASQLERLFAERDAVAPTAVGEDELLQRYVAQLNEMTDDASDRGMLAVFVEAAAWKLALIAYRCGPLATGDVVHRFGRHLKHISMRAEAQREADQAKADGRQPN